MLIGDLIVWPENSLICQSRDAAYHPGITDDKKNRRNILVNGDGFGVSWYQKSTEKGSCVFKFVTPAWSDRNLRNIGEHVSSSLIMAHIRAASSGHDPFEDCHVVAVENCHPFKHKRWTFMHNGSLPRFKSVKLALLNILSPVVFKGITGTTDSEHIFALFLHYLGSAGDEEVSLECFIAAVEQTMSMLLQICNAADIHDPCSLNLVFTDGINVVATRFRSGKEAPPSLYYNWGSDFVCQEGHFEAQNKDKSKNEIVISSAPLSRVDGLSEAEGNAYSIGQWILMPQDHMLVVEGSRQDVSVVKDVYLKHLDLKGFDFALREISAYISPNVIPSPFRPSVEVERHHGLAKIWSGISTESSECDAVVGSKSARKGAWHCNRLRVVESRETSPRSSFTDWDVLSLQPNKISKARGLAYLVGVPLLFVLVANIGSTR